VCILARRVSKALPDRVEHANHSIQFIDAYEKGLNDQQAACAARKYKGHGVLPESLMDDLENANLH
jgi:hypothetical protein